MRQGKKRAYSLAAKCPTGARYWNYRKYSRATGVVVLLKYVVLQFDCFLSVAFELEIS